MDSDEKLLKKLETKILEEFPQVSGNDAMILSGFVAIYATASESIKQFLRAIIQEALFESKAINKASMENIKNQMDQMKSGKKSIAN